MPNENQGQIAIDWHLFKSRLDNIKSFDGDSNTLNKFILKCTKLVDAYSALRNAELDSHIFDCLQEKLTGKAEFMVGNRSEIRTWNAMKNALLQCFSDRRNTDCLVQELTRAKPQKNEHLLQFGNRLQLLRSNVAQRISNDTNLNENEKLCHISYYEKTALNTFIAGCTGILKNNMHLKNLESLEDAMAYVVEFENFESLYGHLNHSQNNNFNKQPNFNQPNFNQPNFNQPNFNNPNNQFNNFNRQNKYQWPSQPINIQTRPQQPKRYPTNREVFGPPQNQNVFKPKPIPPSQMTKPTPMSISVKNSNGFSKQQPIQQPFRNNFNYFHNPNPNQKPDFIFEELHNNEYEEDTSPYPDYNPDYNEYQYNDPESYNESYDYNQSQIQDDTEFYEQNQNFSQNYNTKNEAENQNFRIPGPTKSQT